jgi:hypothetical protein
LRVRNEDARTPITYLLGMMPRTSREQGRCGSPILYWDSLM